MLMINDLKTLSIPYWTGLSARLAPTMNDDEGAQGFADHRDAPDRGLRELSSKWTVAQFVKDKFLPEHISMKGAAGQGHYRAILKHILTPEEVDAIFGAGTEKSKRTLRAIPNWPYINDLHLRDARPEHVQGLISAATEAGYSTQTVKHIRNVVSAIFSHAIREQFFWGGNPAVSVAPPRMLRKMAHALSFEQTLRVLEVMQYPEREVTLFAILTDMTVSQICGLQWKYVNLTDHGLNRMDESIPPRTILVRNQYYRGELGKVPPSRRKDVPISFLLRWVLLRLSRTHGVGWNDFVLMSRGGRPINPINVAARRLKSIGKKLDLPWLSWQVFRRTRVALVEEFGSQLPDKLAMAMASSIRSSQFPHAPGEGSTDIV